MQCIYMLHLLSLYFVFVVISCPHVSSHNFFCCPSVEQLRDVPPRWENFSLYSRICASAPEALVASLNKVAAVQRP